MEDRLRIEREQQGLDGEQKAAESRTKIVDSQIQKEAIHEPIVRALCHWEGEIVFNIY